MCIEGGILAGFSGIPGECLMEIHAAETTTGEVS